MADRPQSRAVEISLHPYPGRPPRRLGPARSAPARLSVVALAIAAIALGAARLLAQTTDPHAVQPERPTVATHAGTVAPGWIEIEAGVEGDGYSDGSRGGSAPILWKIGLAPRLQLSVQTPLIRPRGESATGLGDVSVGVKWRLLEGAPLTGDFAIFPSVKLSTGSTSTGAGTGTTDAGLLLISSHRLGPVSLDINAGYTRRSGDGLAAPRDATLWTVSFGGPAGGPLGWVAEVYGYPATSGPAGSKTIVALLTGPTWQSRSWLVWDAGVIVPVEGPQPRALYFGATYNVGRLWRP